MAAFAVASALSFQAQRRNDPHIELVAATTFTGATFVGLARMYAHHHWLTDVIAGAAVGTASGFVGAALSGRPVRVTPRN